MRWPALLSYQGDNALVYIANQSAWELDPDLQSPHFDEGDRVIDSNGQVHRPVESCSGMQLEETDELCSLDRMIALVQAHMFEQAGATCVSKIAAPNIDKLMAMMEAMDEYDQSQKTAAK